MEDLISLEDLLQKSYDETWQKALIKYKEYTEDEEVLNMEEIKRG